VDLVFGRPLRSEEDHKELIGPAEGIPVFGLDGLSSAAYGPEAALTILAVLGLAGIAYIVPISLAIIALLSIVCFSYRQTIAAYPSGAGSYIVAKANLGTRTGLLAGAALIIDYTLNVAVGISAGVGAIVSSVPKLQPYTLGLCLFILPMLTLINLRGLRDTGIAFMVPTYMFVGCLGGIILVGIFKIIVDGAHLAPVSHIPRPGPPIAAVSLWLLIKAFASGCTAITGVEAVSNGVQAFREPKVANARASLTTIIATLILLLAGIAYLCRVYEIGATPPGQPGYQTVLSQLAAAVSGRGLFYFIAMGAILAVLALSANTSFADFPRLCHFVAEDGYLPYLFAIRGRRLVFSFGICVLASLSGVLLIVFRGVPDRLIPLFAVGAFLAFTLSQAGMVMHWKRTGGRGARSSMLINGIGAVATGLTLCVVIVAKFVEGAWITVLAIPGLLWLMSAVHRHYDRMTHETDCHNALRLKSIVAPIVVLPLQSWSKVAEKALLFAYALSRDVTVVHIVTEDEAGEHAKDDLLSGWHEYVEKPAMQARLPTPELVLLRSPYRLVIGPIVRYVLDLERKHPDRQIAVLVPELVERRWFYFLLHNQRATALKVYLYAKGTGRITVINVPWYLRS
jgi:amino acid transporter